MDEQMVGQIADSTKMLAEAAAALQQALTTISAQQEEISAKVDKIVAAIEEQAVTAAKDQDSAADSELRERVAVLEKTNAELKAQTGRLGRKTLSPLVTMILAKSGVEDGSDGQAVDKALVTLSPEQRIAVKTEMARAGLIQ